MIYVISYDISSNKARKTIHDILLAYGEKINLSVFEIKTDSQKLLQIISKIKTITNPKTDIVKIYEIPTKSYLNTITIGINTTQANYL